MAALPRDFRDARHARKIAALEQRRGGAQIQVELHGPRLAAGEPHGPARFAPTRDPVGDPRGGGRPWPGGWARGGCCRRGSRMAWPALPELAIQSSTCTPPVAVD